MTSLNFKVFSLTRAGFEPVGSGLELVSFGFRNLPEQEVGALLIWPPRLVSNLRVRNRTTKLTRFHDIITSFVPYSVLCTLYSVLCVWFLVCEFCVDYSLYAHN